MRRFKVFKHPTGTVAAVKQGWSWPAFFFVIFWTLFARLWVQAICVVVGMFLLGIALGLMGVSEDSPVINLVTLVVVIAFGVNGNQWREKNLLSRGFEAQGVFEAKNKDAATAAFSAKANAVTAG
jgi:hypothetical protein